MHCYFSLYALHFFMTKSVKVILLQDIPSVGQKHDVKSVRLGFAKNFLTRQKLAMLATPQMVRTIELERKHREERLVIQAQSYAKVIEELKDFALRLRPKKTPKGTLYEGIDAKALAQKLQEKKISVEAEHIELDQPIKKIGEYDIPVTFTKDYQTKIKVIVQ